MNGSDTSAVVDALQRFEDMRKPHTGPVSQGAYVTGKIFHHAPAVLRPLRDLMFDHTLFLQKNQGDAIPAQTIAQLDLIEDVPPIGIQAG